MIELYQHTKIPPRITVLLDSSNEGVRKRFYCPVCGKVAFEYYGELKGLVPGNQVVGKIGNRVVVHCPNRILIYNMDEETGELIANPAGKTTACRAQYYI